MTNLAARMQTAAPAGSIAASEATQRLCEGYFEFRALGPTAVKGLNAPVEVYEVVRAGPLRTHFQLAARRGLTRFVGREREMAAMAGALEQARAGHGQIVAAVGEAGAGKSRLMYEFKATIPDECKVLEAYSVSHGKASAWLPVIELLKSYFEIASEDDDSRRSEKIEAKVRGLDPALAETLPYILSLLGIAGAGASLAMMDAQIRRRRTLEAIKRITIGESVRQPLVVIFEDFNWARGERGTDGEYLIADNPVTRTKAVKIEREGEDIEPFSAEEARRIPAASRPGWERCIVTVALGSGLRPNENFGLKRLNVDLNVRVIRVRQTFSRFGQGGVKNTRSRRDVDMTEPVYRSLREQLVGTELRSPWLWPVSGSRP